MQLFLLQLVFKVQVIPFSCAVLMITGILQRCVMHALLLVTLAYLDSSNITKHRGVCKNRLSTDILQLFYEMF